MTISLTYDLVSFNCGEPFYPEGILCGDTGTLPGKALYFFISEALIPQNRDRGGKDQNEKNDGLLA